jgi:membrane associated rhomboid family serine protease
MNDLLFWPAEIDSRKQYYRFFTCGLVHADYMHLAFNMWALYTFGRYVEQYLFSHPALFGASGKIFFLVLYLSSIIISAVPDYYKNRDNFGYRALGASGAVSAVIFAGIMLQPNLPISILFIPYGIPGYIFGILFLALSAYLAKKGGTNIGHGAHFTGAVYGLVFTIVTAKLFADFDAVKAFLGAILNQ